jgi:arylsulfatase A-like enzyme
VRLAQVAHTPFWCYDPRHPEACGQRQALTQTMDIPPTILDFFNLPVPPDMQGSPLVDRLLADTPARPACLYGAHGSTVRAPPASAPARFAGGTPASCEAGGGR